MSTDYEKVAAQKLAMLTQPTNRHLVGPDELGLLLETCRRANLCNNSSDAKLQLLFGEMTEKEIETVRAVSKYLLT